MKLKAKVKVNWLKAKLYMCVTNVHTNPQSGTVNVHHVVNGIVWKKLLPLKLTIRVVILL